MTHPGTDLRDDQTRWLMEALSLSSAESAFVHLGHGFREFTQAAAVLICQQTLAKTSGVFLRENESPRFFPCLRQPFPNSSPEDLQSPQATEVSPEVLFQELLPDLPVDDFTLQPMVSLQLEDQPVGWVWFWTADQIPLNFAESHWLKEAGARVLANQARLADQLLSDKLSSLAEFAAGAGHEINNPVATISGAPKRCSKTRPTPNAGGS